MFYFHIWYCNLQNFILTPEDKYWKHENVEKNSVFDTNFPRCEFFICFPVNFAKFVRTPFFVKHLQLLLLFVFKNLYCVVTTEDVSMGEIVRFVSRSSSIANLGLFGKLKVQFKYQWLKSNWIWECKPTISTRAVSDIASALR